MLEALLRYLCARLHELYLPQRAPTLLKLFKLCCMALNVVPENEAIAAAHMSTILCACIDAGTLEHESQNHFFLLRQWFRALGQVGARETLACVPTLVAHVAVGGAEQIRAVQQGVCAAAASVARHAAAAAGSVRARGQKGQRRQRAHGANFALASQRAAQTSAAKDLYVELALTIPVRLTHVLPSLRQLMQPLLLALEATSDLVSQVRRRRRRRSGATDDRRSCRACACSRRASTRCSRRSSTQCWRPCAASSFSLSGATSSRCPIRTDTRRSRLRRCAIVCARAG